MQFMHISSQRTTGQRRINIDTTFARRIDVDPTLARLEFYLLKAVSIAQESWKAHANTDDRPVFMGNLSTLRTCIGCPDSSLGAHLIKPFLYGAAILLVYIWCKEHQCVWWEKISIKTAIVYPAGSFAKYLAALFSKQSCCICTQWKYKIS